MKPNHEKISYTAILCARSLAENTRIPYAKEIWDSLKQKGYSQKNISFIITNFIGKFYKGIGLLHSYLEGRYLAINSTLKKLNNPFTIEIAAGMTPRGLEFSNKNYIETDLPKIIKIKKDLSKNAKTLSLNIINKKDLFKIAEIYKKTKTKKPLAITHTGLWTYLNDKEQNIMAENIKETLKKYSPSGYWVSLDFRPRSVQKNIFFKYFRKGITKKTKRQPNRFKSERAIREFMDKKGFNLKVIKNKEILRNMDTIKKFKLNSEEVLKQGSNFGVYVMTLKK